MKTSFITALLAAAALLAGCSKDAPDGGPQPSDGNRVVFTLGGATRAAGDNDASAPLAATDEEKKIDGLLAVAFTDDGNYYKTFDAAYDADSQTASFDVEKNGTYDIWFVANADETLAAALLALILLGIWLQAAFNSFRTPLIFSATIMVVALTALLLTIISLAERLLLGPDDTIAFNDDGE